MNKNLDPTFVDQESNPESQLESDNLSALSVELRKISNEAALNEKSQDNDENSVTSMEDRNAVAEIIRQTPDAVLEGLKKTRDPEQDTVEYAKEAWKAQAVCVNAFKLLVYELRFVEDDDAKTAISGLNDKASKMIIDNHLHPGRMEKASDELSTLGNMANALIDMDNDSMWFKDEAFPDLYKEANDILVNTMQKEAGLNESDIEVIAATQADILDMVTGKSTEAIAA